MKEFAQKLAALVVAKMSPVAQYPALKIIRIRPGLKHPDVVIGLKQKCITACEGIHGVIIITAKVSGNANLPAVAVNAVAAGLVGIMGNPHGIYGKVSYGNRTVNANLYKFSAADLALFVTLPDTFYGSACGVNGNIIFLENSPYGGDVIRVLMGHENPADIIKGKVKFIKSLFYSLLADSNIHKDMGVAASDVGTVPAAPTGNTGKTH